MLRRGDDGDRVRDVQLALIALGHPLPKYGPDGDLGGETVKVFENWYEETFQVCMDFDDGLPDEIVEALLAQHAELRQRQIAAFGKYIVDVRDEAWKGAEKGRNPIKDIDAICLHQMACKDSDLLGWERWRKLAIHFMVSCGEHARAFLLHDLDVRVWHGHGWNRRSVGLEIEGYFSGIGTDERYFWKPKGSNRKPMVPTVAQLEAAKAACRYIIETVAAMGGEIKYVAAHRQSYGYKESDPGELIWKGVALPIMEEFGLSEAPTLTSGKRPGRPIPEAWDPRNVGVPYR